MPTIDSSQFQRIPQILVNGSNTIFGGYIYSADYNIGYGNEGTSSLILNIISDSGTYFIGSNNLNLDQVYSINLGSIPISMYLKRFKKINTPSGKILETEFIDGSFVLDKKWVGLYKRMGAHNTGDTSQESILTQAIQFDSGGGGGFGGGFDSGGSGGVKSNPPLLNRKDCIIIVGKEHHPCDRNYDGNFDDLDIIEDPCHPCFRDAYEQSQNALTIVNCIETVKYQILPVEYNFSMLVQALRAAGLTLVNANDPNSFYRTNYEGKLRDVLSHWCADFGWIFYWQDDQIIFRDARTVTDVNAIINQFCPNISATEEEATLDGTVSSIVVTNYSREGRGKQRYTCQDAVHMDVVPYNQSTARSGPLAITQTLNTNGAVWSLYSTKLRTLYYWFSFYGLDDRNSVVAGNTYPELGMTIITNPIYVQADTQINTGYGDGFATIGLENIPVQRDENLGIIPFLDAEVEGDLAVVQTAIDNNPDFRACFELLTAEDQWKLAADMNGKYFFVAMYNQQLESRFASDEAEYASQLWGQYYIFQPSGSFWENDMFIRDNPNCTNSPFHKDGTVTWQALELANASFSFLNNQDPDEAPVSLSSLPFAKFLAAFKDGNYAPPEHINFKLAMIHKSGEEWNPSPGILDPSEQELNTDPRNNIRNGLLIDQAFTYAPRQVQIFNDENGANVITDILNVGLNEYNNKEKAQIAIFLGSSGTGINCPFPGGSTNDKVILAKPFSGKPLNPNETDDPDLQELVIYEYPQLQCLPIGNDSNFAKQYRMIIPNLRGGTTFFADTPTDANYGFIIEKTKMRNQKLRKVETIMQTGDCPNNQTLDLNVIYQPINDHTIQDIAKIPNTSLCTYNLDAIRLVHNSFAQNLAINQTTPLIKKTFTVEGIDIDGPAPTIDNGLLGMKITAGPDGIRTTYTFGTTKMFPPQKPEVYQLGLMNLLQYMGSLGETFGPGILLHGGEQ